MTQTRLADDKEGVRREDEHPPAIPSRRPHPRGALSEEVVELTAARLRVIAEPKRIALLGALNAGEAGVQELADLLGAPHQNVSHHMAVLHQAGIVGRRREGPESRYAVTDWSAWWVIEQIGRWVESCLAEQRRGQEGTNPD